jgi:hypothetical protein
MPADDTPDIVITPNVGAENFVVYIFTVSAAASVAESLANEPSSGVQNMTMDRNTLTDELVLMIGGEYRGSGEITLAGVTAETAIEHTGDTDFSANAGAHTCTTDETPRTLTVGNDTGKTTNMGGAVIVLEAA